MTARTDQIDRRMAAALAMHLARAIPDREDPWPDVATRLSGRTLSARGAPRMSRLLRALLVGVLCAGLGAGGFRAAVASGEIVPHSVASIGLAPDGTVDMIGPGATFQPVTPKYVPSGLPARSFMYDPENSSGLAALTGNGVAGAGLSGGYSPPEGRALWVQHIPALFEQFASRDGSARVEVVEQAMTSPYALAGGTPVLVDGTTGAVRHEGSDSVVQLALQGTLVTVRTNLGEAEALKVAGSLK